MNNSVDHGCSKLLVSNDLPPFAERKVCRQYQTLVLIAVGNHLEHQFGTHLVQLAIAPFVNDEKVQGPEVSKSLSIRPVFFASSSLVASWERVMNLTLVASLQYLM